MEVDTLIEEAIAYGLSKLGYQELREAQRKVVKSYLQGQDVFVCSPTGSGKSLCFEIAPYTIDYLKHGLHTAEQQTTTKTVCLVVAPLVSLMKDQVASLKAKGVAAICIGPESTPDDIQDTKNGRYNLVFGSPEALLNRYRSIFRGEMIVLIAIIIFFQIPADDMRPPEGRNASRVVA